MNKQQHSFLLILIIWMFVYELSLFALKDSIELLDEVIEKGITVDLRDPSYANGVLYTEKGGVVTALDVRIQAKKIVYTNTKIEENKILKIEAEDQLIVEIGKTVFVGRRLEYDFITKSGILYDGRTMLEPWYVGGKRIILCSDNTFIIDNAFVTTSESYIPDWEIKTSHAVLTENRYLTARNVQFRVASIPLFWLPSFKANLDSIFDSPIKYNIHWRGRQHTRMSLAYQIFSWKRFKANLLLDYRMKRGLGGGVETQYVSENRKEQFQTINYLARDSSIDYPNQRTRFRFQGAYNNLLKDDKIAVCLTYDKLSDKDMATDYYDRGLELKTAGRTQLHIQHQEEELWIGSFLTRVRFNSFQSVKQELPTLEANFKPFVLGPTGIITENQFSISYLDYVYAKHLSNVHNYHSTRYEISHKLYRPFKIGPFLGNPEIGALTIYYGNSQDHHDQWLIFGMFAYEMNIPFYRYYSLFKHVVKPYAKYEYYTSPTRSPNDHFIFDINDGWSRLNTMRFGINQNLYYKNELGNIVRYLHVDLFAYAFFDTPNIPVAVPKIYTQCVWNASPRLRHTFETAWDLQRGQLDHVNFLTQWTIDENLAFSMEYRHRNAFDWRKVDKFNFILESFHSTRELLHSSLSDRRDTLLLHFFYRFDPRFAIELESRHGWNRFREPPYNEYEIDLFATLHSAWNFKIAYQHKENEKNDNRIAVYFSIGMKRPDKKKYEKQIHSLEF